jgi:hypothetical protein
VHQALGHDSGEEALQNGNFINLHRAAGFSRKRDSATILKMNCKHTTLDRQPISSFGADLIE